MSEVMDVRRFTMTSIKDVQKLSKIVFGKTISENYYKTLFNSNSGYLGYLAYADEKLVAFFPAIEISMTDGSRIFKAAQPVSIMIHPDFRQHNYFILLYNKLIELAKSKGIVVFFGWPNSQVLFSKLLRWEKGYCMHKLVIPVKTLPLAKLVYNLNIVYPIYKRFTTLLLNKFSVSITEERCRKLTPNIYPHIPRSADYIETKKKLGALFVSVNEKVSLINIDYRLKIGDIENCSAVEFSMIIKKLKRYCAVAGITEILMYLNPEIHQHQQILSKYNAPEDLVLMYKVLDDSFFKCTPVMTFTDFDTF